MLRGAGPLLDVVDVHDASDQKIAFLLEGGHKVCQLFVNGKSAAVCVCEDLTLLDARCSEGACHGLE